MNTHLHILHLEHREDRLSNLMKELAEQKITDYTIVEGIIDVACVFRGISQAHKRIVRLAKQQKLENVIIAEDDICFTCSNSYEYFLAQMPEDYDIFLGMIYEGEIDEENRIKKNIRSFSGMTIYSVHSRFYDSFLAMKDLAHIDKELGFFADKFKYIVCNPFIAYQMNGYSDQKKRDCKYEYLLKGRKLLGVNA